ncbi:hypothetical protein HG530_014907 [Fusarium avenaceum]|nr:hypothetical protein HG530_014907 [Fusarium avenaceum]
MGSDAGNVNDGPGLRLEEQRSHGPCHKVGSKDIRGNAALLITTSKEPNASLTFSAKASTLSGTPTSVLTLRTSGSGCPVSFATALMASAVVDMSDLDARTIWAAPARAKATHMARPKPRDDPVTRIVLPFKLNLVGSMAG